MNSENLPLTPDQLVKARKFQRDFIFRAKNSLFIKDALGKTVPFNLNKAQLYVHQKLEEQKEKQGYVRAVIVKARKEGISTLVANRYFDNIIRNPGQRAFILAHLESATNELYDMVDVLYENYPKIFRPGIKEANAKRLFFENNSGYSVATAGSGEVGRGSTIQFLHMSEVAKYENGHKISAGLMQAVFNLPNTEIILESTANGKDNIFYKMVQMALSPDSDYQLIFLPWFWLDEYSAKAPTDLELTTEEEELKIKFNLNNNQLFWRRRKILEIGENLFKQEFPATLEEAFDSTAIDRLIPNIDVVEARVNFDLEDDFKRKPIIGVDPAGSGKDKSAIVCRRGRHQYKSQLFEKLTAEQLIEQIIRFIRSEKPAKVFIDKGFNPAIYELLVNRYNYGNLVVGVNFGGQADEPLKYGNKRAEMYHRLKNWFADKPVRIQDSDDLHAELCAVATKNDGGNRIFLESKDKVREIIGRSPDYADALALTFAYNVATYEFEGANYDEEEEERDKYITLQGRNQITGY
jgi:hypothetical protein